MKFFLKLKGQSLLEILVAMSLATIFLGGSLSLFSVSIKSQQNLDFYFNAHSLLREYGEMISYASKNQWNSLFNLNRNTSYKIDFSGNVFSFNQGFEESNFKGINYQRYFKVFDVYRDLNGNISTSGDLDPSTLKVIIYLDYGSNYQSSLNLTIYLTRSYVSSNFFQTDWSGGDGVEGPVTNPSNTFASYSNISYSTSLTLATTTSSGYLISSILDTGVSGGANFHSLIWQGQLCSNCLVRLQLASSNSSSGPWNYYGPTSQDDYYTSLPGQLITLPYTGNSSHQNKRYLRYKVELVPSNGQSPQFDSLSVNFTK